jgi:hypothetical protein
MIRGAGAAVGVVLGLAAAGAEAMERSVLVFGGLVTRNDWGEVVTLDGVEYAETVITGVAGGLHWDLPNPRFAFSMELQLVKYFGFQDSWEVNAVPAMIHWRPANPPGPLESLGFGMGFSYASEPPAVEEARGGATSREKWYWALELGFDTGRPDRDLIMRIHHRSTGSSTIGTGRSTNAVVVGLRQYF